jgi:parallel beta-helix repeat protein
MRLSMMLALILLIHAASSLDCGTILSSDAFLTADIGSASEPCSSDAFIIAADGIALDCQGHAIHGNGTGTGIRIMSKSDVTIKDCFITGFGHGIDASNCSGLKLTNNTLYGNDEGFRLVDNEGSTMVDTDAYPPAPAAEQKEGALEEEGHRAGPLSTTTLMAVLTILLLLTLFFLTKK